MGDAGEVLVRICIFGPVVYVGLLLAVDPARILVLLNRAAEGLLRTLESYRRWQQGQEPFPGSDVDANSSATRIAARVTGLILVIFGVLHIAGIVS